MTGRAGHRHRVYEPLARGGDPGESLRSRHRRHHLHQRQSVPLALRREFRALVERQIGHDEAAHAHTLRIRRQTRQSIGEQRIEVAHQQQRCALSRQRLELLQDPAQAHARSQRLFAGTLDRDAVGHRIGERHPDLHHVSRTGDLEQIAREAIAARETGGQKRYQRELSAGCAARAARR